MSLSSVSSEGASRRRRPSDSDIPGLKRHDDGSTKSGTSAVRFLPITADFGTLNIDQTQYIAMVIPKSMQTVFETFFKDLAKKSHEASLQPIQIDDDEDVEPSDVEPVDVASPTVLANQQQSFLKDFGNLKQTLRNKLLGVSDTELKKDVPSSAFNDFRELRKRLTKWFVTCQHLANKLANNTASNRYIKTTLSFSPAVKDSGIKEACTAKIHKTEAVCEKRLTDKVLQLAIMLNNEITGTAEAEEHHVERWHVFLKAFRVVLRANRYLWAHDIEHSRRPQRFAPRNRDFGNRPPMQNRRPAREWRRRTSRFSEDQYEQNYPPPRRTFYTNYRRYKRQPNYQEETDDDVFEPQYEETVRNNQYRPYRRPSFRRY